MDIQSVINILNEELGTDISANYYSHIEEWRQWWAGFVKTFHQYIEYHHDGSTIKRQLFQLGMGKKVCEDWSSALLGEKPNIAINGGDTDNSARFVMGNPEEQESGGVLGDLKFWKNIKKLTEKAYYSGTGIPVLKLKGLRPGRNGQVLKSPDTQISMQYLPAQCIIPITVKDGRIIDVAFASEDTVKGHKFVYLETHIIENGSYVITNRYYRNVNGFLTPDKLPDGILERFDTGSPYPFFGIIMPNIVNPIPDNLGLGCSIFAQSLDCLRGVDYAFNNYVRDSKLGGKKVFYNRELTQVKQGEDGKIIHIPPDDIMQQLFVTVGDPYVEDKKMMVHEFNPDLRVRDNVDAVQGQLDLLAFKVGFGARYYRFDPQSGGVTITATQYMGEKQELKQNAANHGEVIAQALKDIIRAILWVGRNLQGQPVDPDATIKVEFSDGYIVSDEEKKAADLQEIRDGIKKPWEYRVRWYGEDEATAKAILQPEPGLFGGKDYADIETA
jgi:A118 family predicted phage portal protein